MSMGIATVMNAPTSISPFIFDQTNRGVQEYIWGIGKSECVEGLCKYTPAPHCDDVEGGSEPKEDGSAAALQNSSHLAVLSAALMLVASWM